MSGITFIQPSSRFRSDERGWVFFPFQEDFEPYPSAVPPGSLHFALTRPGAVRGDHYHPRGAEWLYVCGGTTTVYWREGGDVRSRRIDSDDVIIHVPAGVTHTLVNTGDRSVWLAAFREGGDEEGHTVPDRLPGLERPSER